MRRILAGVVAAGVLCVMVGPALPSPQRLYEKQTTAFVFDEDEVATLTEAEWYGGSCAERRYPLLPIRADFMAEMIQSGEAL